MQTRLFENTSVLKRTRSHRGKHNPITRSVIEAFAFMDVNTLERLIPANTLLPHCTRERFFEDIRNEFEQTKSEGVKRYTVGKSFCEICYRRRRNVVTFSQPNENNLAVLFDNKNETIISMRLCWHAGHKKEDFVSVSGCTNPFSSMQIERENVIVK